MRKPRDYDAELKALLDKTQRLNERKLRQLGELVQTTGASTLDPETLTGGLLALMEVADPARKESWRKRGQAFFRGRTRGARPGDDGGEPGLAAGAGGASAPAGESSPS